MTKEYAYMPLFREPTVGASRFWALLSAFRDSVTSRGLPPYRLSSGDFSEVSIWVVTRSSFVPYLWVRTLFLLAFYRTVGTGVPDGPQRV